jgi:predicted DNA-binding transcriptional regulator YafY
MVLSMLPKPPRCVDTATLERQLRERGHHAHRRTIQRDLVQLSAIFAITADERRKPFGWRWSTEAPFLVPAPAPGEQRVARRVSVRLRVAEAGRGALGALVEALRAQAVQNENPTSIVTCSIEDGPHTRRVLLGFADAVEVLAPIELRRELGERIARAHRLYGRVHAT